MKKRSIQLFGVVFSAMLMLFGVPTIVAQTITPTQWEDVKVEPSLDGGILDISTLPESISKEIKIPSGITSLTIKGSSTKSYTNLKIVADNRTTELKLTIENLKISSGTIDIAKNSLDNYLILKGDNEVTGNGTAAILVENGDNKLIIDAGNAALGKLKVKGGADSAAIGGKGMGNNGGHLVIKGGTITAEGGNNAAGIGSGYQRSIKTIKITDNAVIVSSIGGASGGAGIGGSLSGSEIESIEISGKAWIKLAKGGEGAAGIGTGNQSGVQEINIIGGVIGEASEDGSVLTGAVGGNKAAGIGGGAQDKCTITMKITNATIVYAKGGDDAAGIGGGYERGANIDIGNGAIIEKAIGGKNGAGIGCGPNGSQQTINITGTALIKLAQGGENGAGIGGGKTRSAIINISGGNIEHAKGGANAAGIGCGEGNNDSNAITITDGVIYAEGGSGTNTNDIGAGNYFDVPGGKTQNDAKGVPVKIEGGTVFVPDNTMIGKTGDGDHKNYVLVAYKDYDTSTQTGTRHAWVTIRIRTSTGMDKSLTCNSEGRTTFSWEDPTKTLVGYWFQIDDTINNKVYIGYKAETDSTKWKEVYYDKYNNIVSEDASNIERTVVEIPIMYQEGTYKPTPVQTVEPTVGDQQIIPYAVSTIGYSFKLADVKAADPDITEFKKITSELELMPDAGTNTKNSTISFETNAKGGILVKDLGTLDYSYESKSSGEFTVTSASNQIKFECSGEWIDDDNYRITAYIPTKGITEGTSEVALDTYKAQYVDNPYSVQFKVKNIVISTMRQEWITFTPPGGPTTTIAGNIVPEDITLPDTLITVKFYEIPIIN